jgi:ankyrin repeat protein
MTEQDPVDIYVLVENNRWDEIEDMIEKKPSEVSRVIGALIENQRWDDVRALVEKHPSEAKRIVNQSRDWTLLHWLSSIGSTPAHLIRSVAVLNPDAILLQERRYGDTPLHYACRNSQTSSSKLQILLGLCPPNSEKILTRNHFGGTPLHSASNHNAVLSALQALVQANERILQIKTHQGAHAVSTLWHAYIQTIQGHMCVARLLEGDEVTERHFERFWDKCEFLAMEYYHRTDKNNRFGEQHFLHGLMRCNVPFVLFKVALKRNSSYALAADALGNLPLHWILENRPYRLKEKDVIVALVESAPEVASRPNAIGDLPLQIAIRNKIPWENGLEEVLQAYPTVVQRRDAATRLLPFQLAAAVGGKVSVDTTYHLLIQQPDLLNVSNI